LWEGPWAAPVLDLIGAKISLYDTLPAPHSGKVKAEKQTHEWVTWGEALEPGDGARVLAQQVDHFYSGKPAAVTRKLGKGTVTYIGTDSKDGGLEAQLVRDVFRNAGAAVEDFDDGFIVDWRDGFWVATNFTEKKQRAPVPKSAKILVGSAEVPTAGVTVWQE
jgi:beta-galactosidase